LPVELTPSGTRGASMPKLSKPLMKIMWPIANVFLRSKGHRLLSLTTVGAKSGQEHTVYLSYFPNGPDAWLIVGSAGGSPKHPAWYINMARNPDKIWITLDGQKRRVAAESLNGQARETAFRRIVAEQDIYAGYEQKTDREIPVVRLTPA
jgi:deazaflavin-dependent oxidoreductase (nitroreductase family)